MKKLLLSLMICVLLVGTISALEWDNVKSYDPILNEVTFSNSFLGIPTTEIAKARLITPQINYVMPGKDRKVAEFDIDLTADTYNDVLKQIDLINNKDGKAITRQIDYKYKTLIPYEIDVNDYKEVCEIDAKNGSEVCVQEVIGKHKETRYNEIWTPLAKLDLVKGKITIGLFTDVYPDDNVEWIPTLFGKEVTEWATWTSSFNTGLVSYWRLNESSGNITDALGLYNGTNDLGVTFVTGKIGNAGHFTADKFTFNPSDVIGDFGTGEYTLAGWFNSTSTGTYNNLMGKGIGASSLAWGLQLFDGKLRIRDDFSGGSHIIISNDALNDGAWHSYVISRNSSSGLNMYIDGVWQTNHPQDTNNWDNTAGFAIGSADGTNKFTGDLDELGVWNRSLSATEASDLYNGGAGITYIGTSTASSTLNSPVNYYNSSSSTIQFNCSGDTSGTYKNTSLWTNKTGTWAISNTTTTNGKNMSLSFSDGKYNWSCSACDTSHLCGFASENRTVTIDTTAPTVSIAYPTGTLNGLTNGQSVALNYSVSDANLDSCWREYNNTNTTIASCANTTFTYVSGVNSIRVWANDSVGNIGNTSKSWSISYIINSVTYDANITSGGIPSFLLNLSANGLVSITTKFNYNGANYSTTKTGSDTEMVFSNSLTATQNGTIPFYWIIDYGGTLYYSSTYYQGVSTLNFTNCSTGGTIIFNFTMYDEGTKVAMNDINNTIEANVLITSLVGTNIINYSDISTKSNTLSICTSATLSSSPLIANVVVRYVGNSSYISEFYHIQNYSLTNRTTNNNISLYDLLNADAQEFKITYKDASFLPVPGTILDVQRKYISDGIFRTVEIPKFDNQGNTLANLVLGDVIYTLIVKKDNQILATFDNVLAYCDNVATGDCQINLNAYTSSIDIENYATRNGVTFTMSYDKSSRTVQSIFSTTDATTKSLTMNVTLFDILGNTSVCSDSLVSSSGTLSCIIPASFGNTTVVAKLSTSGTNLGSLSIPIWDGGPTIYGGSFVVISLIAFLTIIGMAISGSAVIVLGFAIVGLMLNAMLLLVGGVGGIGIGGSILWLVVAIIVIIWKASRRNSA